jgi:phosphocarrier protein
MKEVTYTIKDPQGIHARPAGVFVKKLQGFTSAVTIMRGDDQCDGKKVLALMKMRIKNGDAITVQFEGKDENDAAAALRNYLPQIL